MDFTFTPHAMDEMAERDIPLYVVLIVLGFPQAILPEQKGRNAYQSEVEINGKTYIVRAIVEPDGTVVTVYRTSKVRKYKGKSS